MKTIHKYIFSVAVLITATTGCKKFISVGAPPTQIGTSFVFNSDATLTAALNGIYSRMAAASFAPGGNSSISFYAGLSADEWKDYSTDNLSGEFNNNSISKTNDYLLAYLWQEPYSYIYSANAILEGIAGSSMLSPEAKSAAEGEAKFIRAFCHFYLASFFGDVPLMLKTDYKLNAISPRTPRKEIYGQVIRDLIDAESLLPVNYDIYNGERTRPVKLTASALLARVYLYTGNYSGAESEATKLIDNEQLYSLPTDLNRVFLKNSTEAIWQLPSVISGYNTMDGYYFTLRSEPTAGALQPGLVASFEQGDARKMHWTDSLDVSGAVYYYPTKYKVRYSTTVTEYYMMMRLAEQYLIRAEAKLMQDKTDEATADMNIIRTRSGLPALSALSKPEILNEIIHQRRSELFTEWGHRWLDIIRLGISGDVLLPLKGASWSAADTLYPIPQTEIDNDPSLTQNPGY